MTAGHPTATLSGREIARQRRAALATMGRAALTQTGAIKSAVASQAAASVAAASSAGCGCGCGGSAGACARVAAQQRDEAEILKAQAARPHGRALAMARRQALARDGKAGLQRVSQAAKIAATMPNQDWQAALEKGATGRQIAMQRRMVQSLTGRTGTASSTPYRPTGRVRPARVVNPLATPEAHTLSGNKVTGTQVERSKRVTGNEAGTCRPITGTEYIGQEQYDAWCESRPAPRPPKVEMGTTLSGRPVSGTDFARAPAVTGTERGACRSITGDEYLGTESFAGCPAVPPAQPPKVSTSHTPRGSRISGTDVAVTARITGNETGACRGITGTQYLAREFEDACQTAPAPRVPPKVSVMSTRGEQRVSGTSVSGGAQRVTGGEAGATRAITGSQYALSHDAVVGVRPGAQTRRGLPEAAFPKHVGDGAPEGSPVTAGIEALRPALAERAADAQPSAPTAHAQRREATWRHQVLTGDVPGAGGGDITGDERGACEPVTGTAYIGPDNLHASCTVSSKWLSRFPTFEQPAAEPAPADFSIMTPARVAQQRRGDRVTGSAMDMGDRVTGPGRKAGGLITGTPEFRHAGVARAAAAAAPWALPEGQPGAQAVAASQRITGEGRQGGIAITGDAWGASTRVTGNEGASVLARNPSLRGQPRGVGTSAVAFRDLARAEVPPSRITGSAGTTQRGAVVTVSGGARG